MEELIDKTEEYYNNEGLNEEGVYEEEKEVAQKILQVLSGIYIVRATQILEFCKKAIQFQKLQ